MSKFDLVHQALRIAKMARGGRLLEDQYPTHYLPHVGRQVMADGGAPTTFEGRVSSPANEPASAPDDESRSLTAYHGSPHEFDRFDLGKIGTGEGAQAYGHGLYFAENEGVAKSYRDVLSKDVYKTTSGETFDPSTLKHLNIRHKARSDIDAAIEKAKEILNQPADESSQKTLDMARSDLAALEKAKAEGAAFGSGHMYEVRIKAHPEHLLDWDKPLSDQPESAYKIIPKPADPPPIKDIQIRSIVKSALRASNNNPDHVSLIVNNDYDLYSRAEALAKKDPEALRKIEEGEMSPGDYVAQLAADHLQAIREGNRTLGEYYKEMEADLGPEGVSKKFKEAGLRGIRYLDQGSRGTGKDTHNYVVFNPEHIHIVRKYAKGGEVEPEDGIRAFAFGNSVPHIEQRIAAGEAPEIDSTQEFNSAKTSRNQVPALFNHPGLAANAGGRNIDLGGGKFDKGTQHLLDKHGITSRVLDPYNRSQEHNQSVHDEYIESPADTATVANVLNVIKEPEHRLNVIQNAHKYLKPGGEAYFSVYEGDGSGEGRASRDGWQENRKLASYLPEVKALFPNAKIANGAIVARKGEAPEIEDQAATQSHAVEHDLLRPIGKSKMIGDEELLFDEGIHQAGIASNAMNNKRSIRYLHNDENGNPIGALQIMTHGPRSKKATIQNVYVSENARRQKIASGLLRRARQDYDVLHSTDLTTQGRAFAKAVKSYGGAISPVELREDPEDVARRLILWSYAVAPLERPLRADGGATSKGNGHETTGRKAGVRTFEGRVGARNRAGDLALLAQRYIERADGGQIDPVETAKRTALGIAAGDRRLTDLGRYSPAAEAVMAVKQPKGRVSDFLNAIKGKPGVTKEEIENSGVENAFPPSASVTRDQLASHFHNALPNIREKVYGGMPPGEIQQPPGEIQQPRSVMNSIMSEDQEYDLPENIEDYADLYRVDPKHDRSYLIGKNWNGRFDLYSDDGRFYSDHDTLEEANNAAHLMAHGPDMPRWKEHDGQSLTLPGGKNYREVVLHLPKEIDKVGSDRVAAFAKQMREKYGERWSAVLTPEEGDNYERLIDAQKDPAPFKSNHWSEPNVLAHLRMQDRLEMPPGETNLDIMQRMAEAAGVPRDQLHTLASGSPEAAVRKGLITPEEAAYISRIKRWKSGYEDKPGLEKKILHLEELQSDWGQKGADKGFGVEGGVPHGPYVTSTQGWTDLGLRRALQEAARGGYDKLVISPGQVHSDRYDLSKSVDSLLYKKNADGTYRVSAQKNNRGTTVGESIPEDKLPDYVGKEIASRMTSGHGDKINLGGSSSSNPPDHWNSLSGGGLQVSEQWPFEFYDKLVPSRLKKIAQKLDPSAKLEMFSHDLPGEDGQNYKGHVLHITPKLRQEVLKGMPAYERGGEISKDRGGSIIKRALAVVSGLPR